MSFAVVWTDEATGDIDQAWAASPPPYRKVVEDAIESALKALTQDPYRVGESRGNEDQRIAFSPPVILYFVIDQPRKLVRVIAAAVSFP